MKLQTLNEHAFYWMILGFILAIGGWLWFDRLFFVAAGFFLFAALAYFIDIVLDEIQRR